MSVYQALLQELQARPRRWLITGVAGFIGSHLLQTLLQSGQKVVGFDDYFSGYEKNLTEVQRLVGDAQWRNFSFIKGSVCDAELCRRVAVGADVILHQAALGSVPRSIENPQLNNEINVKGTLNVFEAARLNGVPRVVYASSSAVYGDAPAQPKHETQNPEPMSPYAVSKLVTELYAAVFAKNYKMQLIGLRYFNVFGSRQDPKGAYAAVIPTWIEALITNKPVHINGTGETTRDFCFVKDVVQANLLAATTHEPKAVNQVYNVASGCSVSLQTLLQTLLELLMPRFAHLAVFSHQYHAFRAGDILSSSADISQIKNLLGFEPAWQMRDGLASTIDGIVARG